MIDSNPWVYRAFLNEIINCNTIDVTLDLGFKVACRQKIKLLEIPCNFFSTLDSETENEILYSLSCYLKAWDSSPTKLIVETIGESKDNCGAWTGLVSLSNDLWRPTGVLVNSWLEDEIESIQKIPAQGA